jgi:hypothetical protein
MFEALQKQANAASSGFFKHPNLVIPSERNGSEPQTLQIERIGLVPLKNR